MANSDVKVILAPGHEVSLTTDNPNIGKLVGEIVKLKDTLVLDDISVICESESFDIPSFTEIVRDSAQQFIEAIQLEEEKFNQVIQGLDKSK